MTRKRKYQSKSDSFVAAAEQVCLQPVLEHRQRRGTQDRRTRWPYLIRGFWADAICLPPPRTTSLGFCTVNTRDKHNPAILASRQIGGHASGGHESTPQWGRVGRTAMLK